MIDITKSLEQTLSEKIIKLNDIQDLKLEEDSSLLQGLNMLCERKAAYRLGADGYIGYQFLCDLILDNIKMEKSIDNLIIEGRSISPNIVSKILNYMENEGLIIKENNVYRAVLDKILSKEIILKFCWGRVDKIKIEDILQHFHFNPTCKVRGATIPSRAFDHVRETLNQLCVENFLQKPTTEAYAAFYSWSDI